MRIVGIIVKNNKVLLMHRIKDGREYYTFPGGSIENSETEIEALKREIREETNLITQDASKLFEVENRGNREAYFLVEKFDGKAQPGGPEKQKMSMKNQYRLQWFELSKIKEIANLYPHEAVTMLLKSLNV